jgi:hypothetical protein
MTVLLVMECMKCGRKIALEPEERPGPPISSLACPWCHMVAMSEKGWYHDLRPGSHPEVPKP